MQMRQIAAAALGTVLLSLASQSFADRDDHRGYRGGHAGGGQWDRGSRHFSPGHYDRRAWRGQQRHDWRRASRGNRVRIYHNYRHRPDYTGIIGGVLIGSAITHSLHDAYEDRRPYGRSGRVTGCYRIERLGGGRERRVELPLSWCR